MPFRNKFATPRSPLATLMNLGINMSRWNKLLRRSILDSEIGTAPAYQIRIRDDIHICPTIPTFNNTYQLLRLPSLMSKIRETAFQVLNRTMWTNMKAFKSRMRDDPNWELCGHTETMEHLLCECLHYSQLLWICLGEIITEYLNSVSSQHIPRVENSQLNVIYNFPNPSLLLHIRDKLSIKALLILTQ
jgi:hypothetical protein